ncbi:MAG: hypothetical protein UW70_C0044G0009 [Candidatus Peregrinibacteria bacterium GW2011_GWA2_44_7]|nr:MAG: hypothetical protein UW70_C0044G0009 [Candidatus Peregrinibacteria bacterium GW2011_GWA2_44_7]
MIFNEFLCPTRRDDEGVSLKDTARRSNNVGRKKIQKS